MGRFTRKLTCSQVVGTVFALGWATCPSVFAIERGKQIARQVVREAVSDTLTPIYGAFAVNSLMDQIRTLDIGDPVTSSDSIVLERPEGTYVFEELMPNPSGGASGHVTMYNPAGETIGRVDFSNVAVPDDNRLDYSIAVSLPDQTWTEDGVLTAIQGEPGQAIALVSVDGADTVASAVDFSGLFATSSAAAGLPLATSTPIGRSFTSQSNVASEVCPTTGGDGSGGAVAVEPCTVLAVVVVVIIVVVVCYVLCWIFGW